MQLQQNPLDCKILILNLARRNCINACKYFHRKMVVNTNVSEPRNETIFSLLPGRFCYYNGVFSTSLYLPVAYVAWFISILTNFKGN